VETIRARIFRFDPATDRAPRHDTFEVPRAPRMRVLDVLDYVYETLAEDIAYRWYCGVKKCGMCAVTVNGSPALACWEAAQPEMTIEPLKHLPVVRDLVTERAPYEELLARLHPLLARKDEYAGFPEPLTRGQMAPAAHLRDCIQCLACYAVCPVLDQADSGFAGPATLVALAELALDPRDGADRAEPAEEITHVFKCVSCYECERVCPAEIPIVSEAIEPLKQLVYRRGEGAGAQHARVFLEVVKKYGQLNAPRLVLGAKGLSRESLRTGLRLVLRGKVDPVRTLFKRPPDAAKTVRELYESSEGRPGEGPR
jgi:succinate dehydrogenase/fumarate reductase iron-sulfur protein